MKPMTEKDVYQLCGRDLENAAVKDSMRRTIEDREKLLKACRVLVRFWDINRFGTYGESADEPNEVAFAKQAIKEAATIAAAGLLVLIIFFTWALLAH